MKSQAPVAWKTSSASYPNPTSHGGLNSQESIPASFPAGHAQSRRSWQEFEDQTECNDSGPMGGYAEEMI